MPISRRGRSSERIARAYLESLGFKILKFREKILVDGVEVGEADFIVESEDGEKFLVEVKSGRLDVNGVRQAYTNSRLLNLKPMIVCRGFSDDSARALASHLNVRVVELNDLFLVDPVELESIIRSAFERYLFKLIKYTLKFLEAIDSYEVIVNAVSESSNIAEASKLSNIEVRKLNEVLECILGERVRSNDYQACRSAALLSLILYKLGRNV